MPATLIGRLTQQQGVVHSARLLAIIFLLIAPGSACSGSPSPSHTPGANASQPGQEGQSTNSTASLTLGTPPAKPAYPKLDALLNQLLTQRGQRPDAELAASAPVSRGDAVAVSIRFTGEPAPLRNFLESNGATVANSADGVIEAYAPLALLPGLDARQEVVRVDAVIPPRPSIQRATPP